MFGERNDQSAAGLFYIFGGVVLEEIREYSVSGAEPVFEMPVNKWVDGFLYNTNGVGMVCYYYVVLHVN